VGRAGLESAAAAPSVPEHSAGRLLCFATAGAGSNDEARILELLGDQDVAMFQFDRAHKLRNILPLVRAIRRSDARLVVMEGTGIAGGASVLLARLLNGTPYVVSSGDAVGPFLGGRARAAAAPGWLYEIVLCRLSAGYIGWTPYLAGRALTFGAPRAMTAANFTTYDARTRSRAEIRAALGIPEETLVVGLIGSLSWNRRRAYCYGAELVAAVRACKRRDVAALIVGDGEGHRHLVEAAGEELGHRIFLPGRVDRTEVTSYLAAMDIGSLPQSRDQVGSFRYTTKLSEYQTAGLPFITGEIPLAYDLADDWAWRVPGAEPWSDEYVTALTALIDRLTADEVQRMRARVPRILDVFDRSLQRRRVRAFIGDILASSQR
jgi:hypothetical protein